MLLCLELRICDSQRLAILEHLHLTPPLSATLALTIL